MTYVLAVSGGVDSMVLLDMLAREVPADRLVVAHFEHGIRAQDSTDDAQFVESKAAEYGCKFVMGRGGLGRRASEAAARQARYEFLSHVAAEQGGQVVTAHHQDDVIETMIINLVRGTGWRGLCPMAWGVVRRPLIEMTKPEIVSYAIDHGLQWREDSTNQDPRYLRNRIRMQIVPKLSALERQKLVGLWRDQGQLAGDIQQELSRVLPAAGQGRGLSRYWLTTTSLPVAGEVVGEHAFRLLGSRLPRPAIARIVLAAKVARPGSIIEISKNLQIRVGLRVVEFEVDN